MKKAITQGVLLLVITVIVGTFVNFQQAEYVKTRKEKAELISLSIATQVEEKINREIYSTNLLEVLIRANDEEPFPAFHRAVSDILRVAPETGVIEDVTTGDTFRAHPLPGFVREIARAGGLINYIKTRK